MKSISPKLWLVFYLLLGFFVFTIRFDISILNTTQTDWLYIGNSDMVADMYSWEYYRSDTSGSLVLFDAMAWPHVTAIGNTNIVPYWAVPLKLLSPWLPEKFQHFGWFILSCYLLQAFFAALLLWKLNIKNVFLHAVGVLFICLSPPFLDRIFHLALCAHWIILALLVVYFSRQLSIKRSTIYYVLLSAIAALTHPYFILFPLAIAAAHSLRFYGQGKKIYSIFPTVFSVLAVFLSFYACGMFSLSLKDSQASGFGYFSANLLTFISNIGKTNVEFLNIPNVLDGQYEGFAYLGAGVLLLYLFQILVLRQQFWHYVKKAWIAAGPLGWITLLLFIFALAFKITIGNFVNFTINPKQYAILENLFSVFRSSGRYAWLAHYLLLIFPLWLLQKLWASGNKKVLHLLLIVIVAIQIWDVSKLMYKPFAEDVFQPSATVKKVAEMLSHQKTVITFPLYSRHIGGMDDSRYFLHYWAKNHINVTAGHLPRASEAIKDSMNNKIQQIQESGSWTFGTNAAMLMDIKQVNLFESLLTDDFSIYQIDNYVIICPVPLPESVAGDYKIDASAVSFIDIKDYLKQYPNHHWIFVARDEASSALKQHLNDIPRMKGSLLHQLGYRHAYCGIFPPHGKFTEKAGEVTAQLNYEIGNCALLLKSFSGPHLDNSSLTICDNTYPFNSRGLMVIIVDSTGNVVNEQKFDTYLTTTATLTNY